MTLPSPSRKVPQQLSLLRDAEKHLPGLTDEDRDFWENRLEAHFPEVEKMLKNEHAMRTWLTGTSTRYRSLLFKHLNFVPVGSLHEEYARLIAEHKEDLIPFILAAQFAERKNAAIIHVAGSTLSKEDLDLCRTSEEQEPDASALTCILLVRDRTKLIDVFHIHRIHRRGFTNLALEKENKISPERALKRLSNRYALQELLTEYEEKNKTGRQNYCEEVIKYKDRHILCIRRDNSPILACNGRSVAPGYEPEWIVLDIEADFRVIRLACDTPRVPVELANLIASHCLGKHVIYQPLDDITPRKQIEIFLNTLQRVPDLLPWVELTLNTCRLEGSPKLRLSMPEDQSLVPTLIEQKRLVRGELWSHIEQIHSIKVYDEGRISLKFDRAEGRPNHFIVRYGAIPSEPKRRAFEERMLKDFKIRVNSAEKRSAKSKQVESSPE